MTINNTLKNMRNPESRFRTKPITPWANKNLTAQDLADTLFQQEQGKKENGNMAWWKVIDATEIFQQKRTDALRTRDNQIQALRTTEIAEWIGDILTAKKDAEKVDINFAKIEQDVDMVRWSHIRANFYIPVVIQTHVWSVVRRRRKNILVWTYDVDLRKPTAIIKQASCISNLDTMKRISWTDANTIEQYQEFVNLDATSNITRLWTEKIAWINSLITTHMLLLMNKMWVKSFSIQDPKTAILINNSKTLSRYMTEKKRINWISKDNHWNVVLGLNNSVITQYQEYRKWKTPRQQDAFRQDEWELLAA